MIRINKQLWIKYKLSVSVFESINAKAYATLQRPLGTTTKAVSEIISHPTLTTLLLPNIIGLNKNSADWDREIKDYVSGIQLSVPIRGYELNLNYVFDLDNAILKPYIQEYIKTYSLDKDIAEKDMLNHILSNKQIHPIDYHKYFKYDEPSNYIYYILALLSSHVANTPEDADKSDNIRFFIYDTLVARKQDLSNIQMEDDAIDKAKSLKSDIVSLKAILLIKNVVSFDELGSMDEESIWLNARKYAKENPSEFLNAANDKNLKTKAKIRRYIEIGILSISENGSIIDSNKPSLVIGVSMDDATSWFLNPVNEGDVTAYTTKYKALKG